MTLLKKIRKAVFPVGGLGTRFLPATKTLPKEMLPLLDKPLIHYAVEEALNSGIEEIIFITGRGKTAIVDYFDRSYELNQNLKQKEKVRDLDKINELVLLPGRVSFVRQQEPLGLGHAVWCARHFVGDEPFAVILADDLILSQKPCLKQLIDAYDIKHPCNMLSVMEVPLEETSKYGILKVEKEEPSGVVLANSMVEKPLPKDSPSTIAAVGRYILHPSIFGFLSQEIEKGDKEIQLTDALSCMSKEVSLKGLRFTGERYDCGDKAGFLEATIQVALRHPEISHQARSILKKVM